ncbi:hypothetical protein AOLI_G00152680 [Acnodon oligacanthus]
MEASTPAHAGPAQASMTAQTGGTVCAAVLHGNIIQGSVAVIYGTQGGQEVCSSSTRTVQTGGPTAAPALTEVARWAAEASLASWNMPQLAQAIGVMTEEWERKLDEEIQTSASLYKAGP